MKRARILLADDHTLLLEALRNLLEPEFEVAGTTANGRALLKAAEKLKPDVIVLDISMPLLNGLEAGRQLKTTLPAVKLIYLTMNHDPEVVTEALYIGASGYLLKSCAISELLNAIRESLRGRSYVSPALKRETIGSFLHEPSRLRNSTRLTPRQREVLQLLAEGLSMKEAAFVLDVTPRTVAFHKYRIMEDLHLKSNAELIQFAIRQQYV